MASQARPEFDARHDDCPMCGGRRLSAYDRDFQGVAIERCDDCRLLFMNPPYTERHLASYYASYGPNLLTTDAARAARRLISKTEDLALIERFTAPGRFLSIGCGDGLELAVAKSRGWQAEGFDVDEPSARRASEYSQAPVRWGDFFQTPWDESAYDCVFMDQVLEHPRNPQDYLRAVRRLLRPGGVLFIGCPNIASLSNRFKEWSGRLGLKRRRRGKHYETSHHLFYYSPAVLGRLVESRFGYEVAAVEGDPFNGRKPFVPGRSWVDRISASLRRRFPNIESTFRMVCRKPVAATGRPAAPSSSADRASLELRT